MKRSKRPSVLLEMYEALHAAYGPRHWWPADTPTEVAIGAVLTQNTAWTNVERAIAALKAAGALDFARIHALDDETLGALIRSAGTYRIKARRLKALAAWLVDSHGGDLTRALAGDTGEVRAALLAVPGIGPETADAILLYAGGHAVFVVDAYTKRILRRHRLIDSRASYETVQRLFESNLPPDATTYNEYHALLVELGKRHCRSQANCTACPLAPWPHDETG